MKPFITGSHAYGTPHEDSDVDLVILVTSADFIKLKTIADDCPELDAYDDAKIAGLRFGRLNLICCRSVGMFEVWRRATEFLKTKAPVDRKVAIEYMGRKRDKFYQELTGTAPEVHEFSCSKSLDELNADEDIPF